MTRAASHRRRAMSPWRCPATRPHQRRRAAADGAGGAQARSARLRALAGRRSRAGGHQAPAGGPVSTGGGRPSPRRAGGERLDAEGPEDEYVDADEDVTEVRDGWSFPDPDEPAPYRVAAQHGDGPAPGARARASASASELAPERPVALVTGANRGIGLEVVRQVAREGFTAIMGSRDREKGEAAAEGLAEVRFAPSMLRTPRASRARGSLARRFRAARRAREQRGDPLRHRDRAG